MFWTIGTAPEAVSVDPETGKARFAANNLKIPDYFNSFNALANGPTLPGEVSFDVRWFANNDSKRYQYSHKAEGSEPDSFTLDYWSTQATLEWRAQTTGGFSFESYKIGSYPANRSPGQLFAIAGRERNGVFHGPFPPPSGTSESRSRGADGLAATGSQQDFLRLGGVSLLLGGLAGLVALRRRSPAPEIFLEPSHVGPPIEKPQP